MEDNQQNQVQQPQIGQPPIVSTPPQSSPSQQIQMETPLPKNKFPRKTLILILLFALLLASGGGLIYFLEFRTTTSPPETQKTELTEEKDKSQVSTPTSELCQVSNFPEPQIKYPRIDNSVILISGMVDKDFNLATHTPWYRLAGGEYDIEFDRETEGELILQIQDKNDQILKKGNFNLQFSMPVDPGTPIQLDTSLLGITAPYPWEARDVVFRTNEKLIKNINISSVLINNAISLIPAQAFRKDKEVSHSDLEGVLDLFNKCLSENNDIAASRILEFHLLPAIEDSLTDDFKKSNILKMDKTEITELIKETIARLDSSRTSDPLPSQEGNIQLNYRYFPLASDLVKLEIGQGIRYVRYDKQIELTRINDPECLNKSANSSMYICNKDSPLEANLLITNRKTNNTKNISLTKEQEKIDVFGMEISLSHIVTFKTPPYTDFFVRMTE